MLTFYDKQVICHQNGYIVRGRIVGKQFELQKFENGVLGGPGERMSFTEIPKGYQAIYERIYNYLITNKQLTKCQAGT